MDCTNLVYAISDLLKATGVFLVVVIGMLALCAPSILHATADRIRGTD